MAIFLALLSAFFMLISKRKLAVLTSTMAAIWLSTVLYSPAATMLISILEERFERPELPEKIAGIIILGGGIESEITSSRDALEVSNASDRIIAGAQIAKLYPNVPIIYTGGSGLTIADAMPSAPIAEKLFILLGVDSKRIVIEQQARNTFEHAVLLEPILQKKSDDPFLLITSAFHMPRSMGVFEKRGWRVLPYPVDYRTAKTNGWSDPSRSVADNYLNMTIALKEWFGLASYRVMGRTENLLPGPQKSKN